MPGLPGRADPLESPIISPRLRAAASRCFGQWEGIIAARLRADGWPEGSVVEGASAALALIEGALLLARVSGQASHLANAKRALLHACSAGRWARIGRVLATGGARRAATVSNPRDGAQDRQLLFRWCRQLK